MKSQATADVELQNSSEVTMRLSSQSDIDATSVDSSYTSLNVFIWAIPILGFIGTVIGISSAVGAFSGELSGAADMEVIRNRSTVSPADWQPRSNTTLLALIMSLLVMFPKSAMQKSEEDLLNSVDEYCNENLLKRLKGAIAESPHRRTIQSSRYIRPIEAAMADHHAELADLDDEAGIGGETLSRQVVDGWSEVDGILKQNHQAERQELETLVSQVVSRQQTVADKLESIRGEMSRVQGDQAEQFKQVLAATSDESKAIDQRSVERQEARRSRYVPPHRSFRTDVDRPVRTK